MILIQPTLLPLLFGPFLLLPSTASTAVSHSADCSSCDHFFTKPVYYGCIGGDAAYVTFDSVKIECGAALSLNTTSSIPRFHYLDAEADALYTLLLMDTTEINPIVGTVAPFLPFPIIHYGALNIPGDVLIEGMTLGIFAHDDTGVRVQPFLSYVEPVPSEELKKIQPDYTPPDLNTRAFNYEFMLGKQRYEKDPPLMDLNTNWEFIGFLKKTIFGDLVAATYFSTGYCVKDIIQIDQNSSGLGVDCPLPPETLSGKGSVPTHVAGVGGYGSSLSSGPDGSDGTSGPVDGSVEPDSGSVEPDSGSTDSASNDSSDGTESAGGNEGDDVTALSSSDFGNRLDGAAAISCIAGLMYCIIGF